MVLGDFNALLTTQDKEGGMLVLYYETSDLDAMVQSYDLVDLRSMGCWLTWTNGKISRKLDRTLVNTHWLLANYQSYAEFLSPGCLSEHSCCIVDLLRRE